MDEKELFKNVLNWSYYHCRQLWNEFRLSSSPEKRRHAARKILIEKVKKEPDTELLISPDLKEKILLKEGVDLKQINAEYQEKKGSSKVKQEPKIYNKEPCTDIDSDEDSIKNLHLPPGGDSTALYDAQFGGVGFHSSPGDGAYASLQQDENSHTMHLSKNFRQEWNHSNWYHVSAIASKLGIHRKTIGYWREFGIKINGTPIRLQMVKRPFHWYAKGEWIIEFFLKTNINVDME